MSWLPAAASAALTIGGALLGRSDTKKANEANRQFQLDMWNRNNEYNTPYQQRQRLLAAGFSPHLVYGNGTVANTAQNQNMPDAAPLPGLGLESAMGAYYDTTQRDAQIENTRQQTKSLGLQTAADLILKGAQTRSLTANAAGSEFDTAYKGKTEATQIALLNSALTSAGISNAGGLLANKQKEVDLETLSERNQLAMDEARQRITASKQSGDKTQVETQIQREMLELYENGVNPNDPIWMRWLAKIVDDDVLQNIQNWIKSKFSNNKPTRKPGQQGGSRGW